MEALAVDCLEKSFGHFLVLNKVSFTAEEGHFVSVLGASGCGKTTLLRIIAGLERPDSGRVYIDGKDVTFVPSAQRNIGMVFQSYSLFPNMTVLQNIIYPTTCRKKLQNQKPKLLEEIIQRCGLADFLDRYPDQLSGGEQQRTAIARALVASPKILLLDEPFSALDVSLRQNLRKLIKRLQKDLNITIIYVTHDQEDAFTLSDKIVIINESIIQQTGRPEDVYRSPQNSFISGFICKQLSDRYRNLARIVHPTSNVITGK